jgi:MYXO-CTERM domain-containing protein
MPSMYGAALLADDDDGNLANGTPNGCEINAAFGSHGLFSAGEASAERVTAVEQPEGLRVQVDLSLPSFEGCPLDATTVIEWGPRDGDGATQTAPMEAVDGGFAAIVPPLPPGEVMRYRVRVTYSNGTERIVPPNLGDPWFQHWFGQVQPIYCTSFADETAEGWSLPQRWHVSPPLGLGGDPEEAAGPDPFVLGQDLLQDGLYEPWSSQTAYTPEILVPSGYASVRLHYWRWLTVEDGFYDQAYILADDQLAWSNFASNFGSAATTHHRDSQWVFHDVDLTPWASDGAVRLGFGLDSDGGLEMGGWTIDELCVVGYQPVVAPGCGNGVVDVGEQCDDGNVVSGDGCSAQCQLEDPGSSDGGDDGSEGDDGSSDDGDDDPGLTDDGRLLDRGCTCQARSEGGLPAGFGALALLLLGWRRRRS